VSSVLAEEYLGLEEIDNDLGNVYFGPLNLGRMDKRDLKIEDALGRKRRKKSRLQKRRNPLALKLGQREFGSRRGVSRARGNRQ
jgi:hypothetical protein